MTVRFLQVTASAGPGCPFMPGQVVHLAGVTPEVRTWLSEERAEIVPDIPEVAIVPPAARAVLPRAKGRHARAAV